MFGKKKDESVKITKEQILERLKGIKYPGYSRDIVSFGMIKDVEIDDSRVRIVLNLISKDPQKSEQIAVLVREQLESMVGVESVELRTETPPPPQAPISHAPGEKEKVKLLPEVPYKIAVGSGKGGVGKSTVAVNLAVALAKRGARVALLDADIYGPNIPVMMGAAEKPRASNNKVLPIERYGVKIMSIGFFMEGNSPVIWRGPLVGKAIEQLLRDVLWEDIDFFLVDLPPGTGDAQLSLSSLLDLSGAVMVATPQDVAMADVIKGVQMFQKVDVNILGLVENMSYFVCPHCGERTEIFDHGTTRSVCEEMGLPFLGEVPLDTSIREGGDSGQPVVARDETSPQAESFLSIADRILEKFPIQK